MANTFANRLSHAWDVFRNKDPILQVSPDVIKTYQTDTRYKVPYGIDKTIVTTIINRMAVDVASYSFRHIRVDENEMFLENISSSLDNVFTVEANIDQTSNAFFIDLVTRLLSEGCVAVIPRTSKPPITGAFEVNGLRCGKVVDWYTDAVKVELYNEETGHKDQAYIHKSLCAIIENPFFNILNERSSILRRLTQKLALLDIADEQSASPKLDILIQLPYVVKSELREQQAKKRKKEITDQLADSAYGIAYIDGSEKIVQLNRPAENNIQDHIKYLTDQLFAQLGITEAILNGSASEQEMLNYYTRTLDPILHAIVDEFSRKFLTKTARTQGQAIKFFREPFCLTPSSDFAELADKLKRNEILTTNEIRAIIGYKPAVDAGADQLSNPNMPQEQQALPPGMQEEEEFVEENDYTNIFE